MKKLNWIKQIILLAALSFFFFSCDDEGDDSVDAVPSISLDSTIPTEANYDEGITISANVIASAKIKSIALSLSGTSTPLITKESGFTNTESDLFTYTYTSNKLEDVGETLTFDLTVIDKKDLETTKSIDVKISDAQIVIDFTMTEGETTTSVDSIGTLGETASFDLNIESNIGLSLFKVEKITETVDEEIEEITSFENAKSFTYDFSETLGGEYYLITATDKSGLTFTRKYWVSTPLSEGESFTFGAQQSSTGSFFSTEGAVTQSEADANPEEVILMYYVDETNGVTFAAPSDESTDNFFASVISEWDVRNVTLFKKATDASIYEEGLNYMQLERAYELEENEESESISGFIAGDVILFKTFIPVEVDDDVFVEAEIVVMMKITSITEGTDGTITISAVTDNGEEDESDEIVIEEAK